MSSVADLEAALQARWNRETLAVYGDALEAAGDPRGELIAIDLQIAEHGRDPALIARRLELITAWLGSEWHSRAHWLRYGFVDDYRLVEMSYRGKSDPYEVRSPPTRTYLRALRLHTGGVLVRDVVRRLLQPPLPWLHRLSIELEEHGRLEGGGLDGFAEGTPNLVDLRVSGPGLLATPGPPTVRTLRITGDRTLIVRDHGMPQIEELELVFDRDDRRERLTALVNPRLFPGLRRLDLSANEPYGSSSLTAFELAPTFEALGQLVQLRTPSVRNDADVDVVLALLARYPSLTIQIARTYKHTRLDDVRDARLRLAPPRKWLPPDVAPSQYLRIAPIRRRVPIQQLIWALEHTYDTLHPRDRAPWDALWDAFPSDPAEPFELDAATLAAALEQLPDERICVDTARELRALDRTTVTLTRADTW